MLNSYSETLAAGIATIMVVIAAHWIWEIVFARLTQGLAMGA